MPSLLNDTIAAIATAIVPQQGSVGIVRLSGDRAEAIARILFHAPGQQPWESHRILYGYVCDPATAERIDESLLLLMRAPRSYTREDVVEFHCHGGIMAVQRVLDLCLKAGARLAQPGEFTLRAFLNGRIDLTQAESIADLVGARSPQAAQSAMAALQGKLSQPLRDLRGRCLDLLAEIEARLDFEEELPPLNVEAVTAEIAAVRQAAQQWLATADRGELLRSGVQVAIAGRPNVGKSSLLNAWSRSDRAIVADLPGTTRDVVDSLLVVGGIPVRVLDTAGIRATEDVVERIGVARSRRALQSADLVLLTFDASAGWLPEDGEILALAGDRPVLLVANKIDLVPAAAAIELPAGVRDRAIGVVRVAAAHQQGIAELEAAILHAVKTEAIAAADLELCVNQRQKACLQTVVTALDRVGEAIAQALPLDFWTIDLRGAAHALGEILGEEVTESVLDRIFSRFCLGK